MADIIRIAVENGILEFDNLYLTENEVIKKINKDKKLSKMWKSHTEIFAVVTSAEKPENQYCVNVSAKKRYIDPLVLVKNNAKRLTDIDIGIRDQIQTFLNIDFNKWIFKV